MLQALIVALIYWALILLYRFGANGMADRPIFVGPVVGFILGDVTTGVLIGASLEVIYLGVVNVGGATSTDTLYATCMAVALSIMTGIPQEVAITLGIALGYIGLLMLQVTRIFFAFMCPILDKIAEEGNSKKYSFAYLGHIIVGYGFGAVTIFIALAAGADATQEFISSLPTFVMGGLQTAAGLLPALGLGILLSMLWDNKKAIYFVLGFILVVYLKIPTLALAVIGTFLMLADFYKNQELYSIRKLITSKSTGVIKEEEEFFNE
ncbi:MAG: PTS sugar transporter subunit IIC [Anaerorhabdus sp.]|uniref:PTS mannose/fructose/sorbose/N-acetylgalactosamine transporter subunit IIC n=1 Tax=Anaerorhabdus sp. TaxID=1872524 RepID=UPI002FCC3780